MIVVAAHRHPSPFVVALVCAAGLATSAQAPLVPPNQFRGGVFEASGVIDVPGANGVLFVDDDHPKRVLWMPLSSAGVQAGDVKPVAIHATVPDMEDITTDGDFAIRGLGYDRERQVALILAGPSTDGPANDFGLYEWDGETAASLRQIGSYPAHQKAEGIARLTLGGVRKTIVVFDSSGYRVQ